MITCLETKGAQIPDVFEVNAGLYSWQAPDATPV